MVRKTLTGLIPHITYPGERMPSFVVRKSVRRFFHGSCRKPHHDSEDRLSRPGQGDPKDPG